MRSRLRHNPTVDRAGTILRAIVHECKAEQITFMAGSIAYNAFASLLPLLFLLLALVSAVGGGQLESNLIELTRSVVTPGAGEVLVSELRNASVSASALGFAVLAWGMLRIFRSLDTAFSDIYETEAQNTFTDQLTDGLAAFGSIAAVILVVAGIESAVTIDTASGPAWVVQRALLICVVAVALVPMYYLFPDEADMRLVEVLPGAVVTASGLVVLQSVFSLYVAFSSQAANNSVLAGILVFLTWLYFSGLILLVGVAINAVFSNRSEDVNIEPVIGGVPRADLQGVERTVPEERLQQLSHSLAEAGTVQVTVGEDGEDITVPAPDIVTVDTDTSPLPGLNDTASLELRWAQDQALRDPPGE